MEITKKKDISRGHNGTQVGNLPHRTIGTIIISCDAPVQMKLSMSSRVARNYNGKILEQITKIQRSQNPLEVEAKAIWEAVLLAKQKMWTNCVIESDSSEVINTILDGKNYPNWVITQWRISITRYFSHIDVSVATALLLQRNPCFAQLSSAVFGLFYCGYLSCFWEKLRCGMASPALNTGAGTVWRVLIGGQTHRTVSLVATLISFSSITVADTFAFLGGKTFGRTPLTNVNPKKTWEGAIAGLSGCIAISVLLLKIFSWPSSFPRYLVN